MKIVKDERFLYSLQGVLSNIAEDNIRQSMIFNDELDIKIEHLSDMPWKFRQSLFHKSKNVRDLVYKGYVVPYLVDIDKNIIVVLNIFKNRSY